MIEAPDELDIVQKAERVVLAALPKRLSDKAIARATGVKLADLSRAFLAVRGAAIYPSLHALRLDAADRILAENPELSPEAVALQCGFGHFGVFHRNYRRRFGHEPGLQQPSVPYDEVRSFAVNESAGGDL